MAVDAVSVLTYVLLQPFPPAAGKKGGRVKNFRQHPHPRIASKLTLKGIAFQTLTKGFDIFSD